MKSRRAQQDGPALPEVPTILTSHLIEAYHPQVVDAQDAAVEALEEVVGALTDAQFALHVAEVAARKALRQKDRGVPRAASLRATPVTNYRPDVDNALTRLEQARHRMLVATFAVALEDGMTIGELSRIYGFSRQLASRYAKEARSND